MPFIDEYFDKVYSIALLHHIPQRNSLKSFSRGKKGFKEKRTFDFDSLEFMGEKFTRDLIFQQTKAKVLGKSKLDFKDILMKWEGVDDCYFHCFTERELKKLVKRAGFSIIKSGEILVGTKSKKTKKLPTSNLFVVAQK